MTEPPNDAPVPMTPEALAALAAYAALPLAPERLAALGPLLTAPLAVARALRPEGYDDLQPAMSFRVPCEG